MLTARIWQGGDPETRSEEYLEFMETAWIGQYHKVKGFIERLRRNAEGLTMMKLLPFGKVLSPSRVFPLSTMKRLSTCLKTIII